MKKIIFTASLLFSCLAFKANAQSQKIVADKIIAQVGDKIILQSDIVNAIADYKRQGQEQQLPANPECAFLEGQLIQKALVLQAEKDSLTVSDDELDALLDNQVRYFIQSYGSQEILEQIAGKTVYQLKEDLRQPFTERQLANQMRNKILENVKISPTEVKDFFDKIPKDSLSYFESELEVGQIISYPKPNKDIEEYVTNQLLTIKKQVESGAKKFADLAKIYSQDPGSKDNGGQMNINRADHLDPTFMAAAFNLKEGQISPVIKSKFGLHIIQMVSRAGADAIIRPILIIPTVTDAEINTSKAKLDSVRTAIISGNLSFGAAVFRYSDDDDSKNTGGLITSQTDNSTYLTIDKLDKDVVVALKNLKVGDISQPAVFNDDRTGKTGVMLVYLKSRTEPHLENMRDDYNKIADQALDQKKQQVLEKWFQSHIPNYYISIDKEFGTCNNISDWIQAAAANASK
jgi:peptidyl-prolyl cis-trans isomerase SurA